MIKGVLLLDSIVKERYDRPHGQDWKMLPCMGCHRTLVLIVNVVNWKVWHSTDIGTPLYISRNIIGYIFTHTQHVHMYMYKAKMSSFVPVLILLI